MKDTKKKYIDKVIKMNPIDVYADESEKPKLGDQFSGSGKLWLEGFKSSSPSMQYKLIDEMHKEHPVEKEYRNRPSNIKSVPVDQEMRNKEYKELIKQKNKLLRDKTA